MAWYEDNNVFGLARNTRLADEIAVELIQDEAAKRWTSRLALAAEKAA